MVKDRRGQDVISKAQGCSVNPRAKAGQEGKDEKDGDGETAPRAMSQSSGHRPPGSP